MFNSAPGAEELSALSTREPLLSSQAGAHASALSPLQHRGEQSLCPVFLRQCQGTEHAVCPKHRAKGQGNGSKPCRWKLTISIVHSSCSPRERSGKSSKHQLSFPQHSVFRPSIQKTVTLQGQEAATGNGILWEKGTTVTPKHRGHLFVGWGQYTGLFLLVLIHSWHNLGKKLWIFLTALVKASQSESTQWPMPEKGNLSIRIYCFSPEQLHPAEKHHCNESHPSKPSDRFNWIWGADCSYYWHYYADLGLGNGITLIETQYQHWCFVYLQTAMSQKVNTLRQVSVGEPLETDLQFHTISRQISLLQTNSSLSITQMRWLKAAWGTESQCRTPGTAAHSNSAEVLWRYCIFPSSPAMRNTDWLQCAERLLITMPRVSASICDSQKDSRRLKARKQITALANTPTAAMEMSEGGNSGLDTVGGKGLQSADKKFQFAVCTKVYRKNTPIKAVLCYAELGQLLPKGSRSIWKQWEDVAVCRAGSTAVSQETSHGEGQNGHVHPDQRCRRPWCFSHGSTNLPSLAAFEPNRLFNSSRGVEGPCLQLDFNLKIYMQALDLLCMPTAKWPGRTEPFPFWKGTHPLYSYEILITEDEMRSSSLKKPPLTCYFSLLFAIWHFISLKLSLMVVNTHGTFTDL